MDPRHSSPSTRQPTWADSEKDCDTACWTPKRSSPPLDRGLTTRNWCILSLAISWCTSVAALACAAYSLSAGPVQVPAYLLDRAAFVGTLGISWVTRPAGDPNFYLADHRVFRVSQTSALFIPLLVTVAVTVMVSGINSIRSATLRWALWREGRLRHNANLRLFGGTRRYGPNGWPANAVAAVGLALIYGGTTSLVLSVYIFGELEDKEVFSINENIKGNRYAIDFNNWGILGVGVGLFIQSASATWCLFSQHMVGTWNSSPLATARACTLLPQNQGLDWAGPSWTRSSKSPSNGAQSRFFQSHTLSPCKDQEDVRTKYFAFDLPFTRVETMLGARPQFTQPSILDMNPKLRWMLRLIWATLVIVTVWAVIIAVVGHKEGTMSAAYLVEKTGRTDFWSYWQAYGQVARNYTHNAYREGREWIGLLVQSIVLVFFLSSLEVAELIVELARDESTWRRAATVGAPVDSSHIKEDAQYWGSWVIFSFKFLVPWIFGSALTCNSAVFMAPIPLFTLVGLYLGLAVFGEYLARVRPRGPQPATYGDIQALISLVDSWREKIFWGDKGEVAEGIRWAGTSGRRLADLGPDYTYINIQSGKQNQF